MEFEIDGMEAIGHSELGHYSKAVETGPDEPGRTRRDGTEPYLHSCSARRRSHSKVTLALLWMRARAVLAVLADGVTSPRTLNNLRPVRAIAQQLKDEDFCTRFDSVSEALTA